MSGKVTQYFPESDVWSLEVVSVEAANHTLTYFAPRYSRPYVRPSDRPSVTLLSGAYL